MKNKSIIAGIILWVAGLIITAVTDSDIGLYVVLIGFAIFLAGIFIRAKENSRPQDAPEDVDEN